MSLSSVVNQLQEANLTKGLYKRCNRPDRLLITGAGRAAKAILSTAIAKEEKRPLLVIVATMDEASRWVSLLELAGWGKTFSRILVCAGSL